MDEVGEVDKEFVCAPERRTGYVRPARPLPAFLLARIALRCKQYANMQLIVWAASSTIGGRRPSSGRLDCHPAHGRIRTPANQDYRVVCILQDNKPTQYVRHLPPARLSEALVNKLLQMSKSREETISALQLTPICPRQPRRSPFSAATRFKKSRSAPAIG
jgi:hypothetical protein